MGEQNARDYVSIDSSLVWAPLEVDKGLKSEIFTFDRLSRRMRITCSSPRIQSLRKVTVETYIAIL